MVRERNANPNAGDSVNSPTVPSAQNSIRNAHYALSIQLAMPYYAIEAGVQLAYWWSYQSDREQDQNDPQRLDLEVERNPELIKAIVQANQRLKRRLACP